MKRFVFLFIPLLIFIVLLWMQRFILRQTVPVPTAVLRQTAVWQNRIPRPDPRQDLN